MGHALPFDDTDLFQFGHRLKIVEELHPLAQHNRYKVDGDFVQQSGMSVYDTVKTMVTSEVAGYGEGDDGSPTVYGLASQSFG